MKFSESDVPLLRPPWKFLLAFAQSLTESIYTFTMNNTISIIFVVYLLIVWKITSCGLFCICCLLALFEKDTAVSWIVKNSCPLFILCVANGCRGLYCIPSSVVSFSCQHLFLTEPVQTLIIPVALL